MPSAITNPPEAALAQRLHCSCVPVAASPFPLTRRLVFQWHVTERCNLRCAHCYQESHGGPELGFDQWLSVLGQLETLLDDWPDTDAGPPRLHINVTGGEPFVHRDFLSLLQEFSDRRDRLSFAILCNGHFIDAAMARKLAVLSPGFVQVSIEGLRATHDRIRGRGSFDRTVAAIQHLTRTRIPVLVSFTAHRDNYREYPEVVRLACQLRVRRVWADRLIPPCSSGHTGTQSLKPAETREFLELMRSAREEASRRWFCRTEVAQHRALQFLSGSHQPYRCTAGASLLALLPNGDLLSCRRLPISIGNLVETSLSKLYHDNATLRALRDPDHAIRGCEACAFRHACRGGLRCLAYAVCGDPYVSDPGCWLAGSTESANACAVVRRSSESLAIAGL